jgi:hypothetical protein
MKWRLGIWCKAARRDALLFFVAAMVVAPCWATADEPDRRVDVGIAPRFMPTGSFEWSKHDPSNPGAYPALGGALFADYRLNRFFSVGIMPELTLNVIPRVSYYPVSVMVAGSLRLKAQFPLSWGAVPYVTLAPGYSWLFGALDAAPGSGESHGFALAGYGGVRAPISARHSLFVEVGYLRGFQSGGGRTYAPSYLVLALGWQVSI